MFTRYCYFTHLAFCFSLHCFGTLLAGVEGHRPLKILVSVCQQWWPDCSFAFLGLPVVTIVNKCISCYFKNSNCLTFCHRLTQAVLEYWLINKYCCCLTLAYKKSDMRIKLQPHPTPSLWHCPHPHPNPTRCAYPHPHHYFHIKESIKRSTDYKI